MLSYRTHLSRVTENDYVEFPKSLLPSFSTRSTKVAILFTALGQGMEHEERKIGRYFIDTNCHELNMNLSRIKLYEKLYGQLYGNYMLKIKTRIAMN